MSFENLLNYEVHIVEVNFTYILFVSILKFRSYFKEKRERIYKNKTSSYYVRILHIFWISVEN